MPVYSHCGLYAAPAHIQQARQAREREPFQDAWVRLTAQASPAWDHELIVNALRYRFDGQPQSGELALIALQNGVGLDAGQNRLDALMAAVTLAQAYELVRDHPAFPADAQSAWRARFARRADHLSAATDEALTEYAWNGLLQISSAVVLEDDARFEAGAQIYRQIIQNDIRPEGYLPRAVEGGDSGSLERQLLSVAALVLMAEAAEQVGVDLWSYAWRGISVITAASYCIYYYYYPDQWRWGSVSEAESNATYKTKGGFLEMVNRRARPKDLQYLLKDLRPFFHPAIGGLTTLTHGVAAKKGLWG